jgi:HK97 family phage portal protein
MESHHQGARNAGRPMLLEGGLDWKPMGFSPSDMEFQKTKEAAAREIAIAFGIPPMLLGIPGDATYANYQEANRAFYRLTVLPLAQKVLADLARWQSSATSNGRGSVRRIS